MRRASRQLLAKEFLGSYPHQLEFLEFVGSYPAQTPEFLAFINICISAFSHQYFFMRTTLELPDPLFKEVKMRAVRQGVKLKDLIAAYIEAGLRAPQTQGNESAPRRNPRPLPVGIPRIPGAPLHPALTNAELYAILEEEDIESYHRVIARSPTNK